MTIYRDRIEQKLSAALSPQTLVIEDESHLHAGHAGAHPDGGDETHFKVRIVSDVFEGENRVARQRRVYALLSDELNERVHALSLTTQTPAESKSGASP
ncbi:MAG: BolA family transcriptional regulator [Rhodospirillaceae bacterium]|nr:BolA family transcriptional regulator [Rhodospirillaceae bacterium]